MSAFRSRTTIGEALRWLLGGGLFATAAFLAPTAAQALDPLGNARVSFRADVVVTADGHRHRGRVYHRPGMQRHEFPGLGVTRILRFDLNRMWTLDHRTKTYTEAALEGLGPHAGIFDRRRLDAEVERKVKLGKESLERHKVRGMTVDRTQIDGEAWVSGDGILFRLDLQMQFVGVRYDYRLELHNVRRMAIGETLFDVPVGYRQVTPAPVWEPPTGTAVAGTGPRAADGIERMTRTSNPPRVSRPGATTSRDPAAKNPYSLEQIFRDGTTSKK